MAFVNEYASAADIEKYNLKEVFYKAGKGRVPQYAWTVDHARGIYLEFVRMGREEETGIWTFFIWWNFALLVFDVRVNGGGVYKGSGWRKYSNLKLSLSVELERCRAKIVEDIKEALVAFGEFGPSSNATSMSVTCFF